MHPDSSSTTVPPRWLHGLALLTVLFTLPLLFLGASVTSHDVGMVDARGFRPPWDIINDFFLKNDLGWRLEYGHRTFGFLVGLCGIALAVSCWFFDRRPAMGWLAVVALGLICLQGSLGIFRVDYNAVHGRTFALLHGALAQIVFATLVMVSLFLSRRWIYGSADSGSYVSPEAFSAKPLTLPVESTPQISPALERWSILTTLLVFGQLILGGLVRHKESLLGPRGHLLGAFVVVGAVVWLLKLIRESECREVLRRERIFLMVLALQLVLGVESWLAKFAVPQADLPQLQPAPMHAEWIRTAHYLVGTLLFSTTVVIALIANRKFLVATAAAPVRPHELEGVL